MGVSAEAVDAMLTDESEWPGYAALTAFLRGALPGVPSTVYFVEAVGTGCVKIGFTRGSVEDRLAALACTSPCELVVLATVPGGWAHEQALHRRFASLRVRGEWFRLEGDLASFLGEEVSR